MVWALRVRQHPKALWVCLRSHQRNGMSIGGDAGSGRDANRRCVNSQLSKFLFPTLLTYPSLTRSRLAVTPIWSQATKPWQARRVRSIPGQSCIPFGLGLQNSPPHPTRSNSLPENPKTNCRAYLRNLRTLWTESSSHPRPTILLSNRVLHSQTYVNPSRKQGKASYAVCGSSRHRDHWRDRS